MTGPAVSAQSRLDQIRFYCDRMRELSPGLNVPIFNDRDLMTPEGIQNWCYQIQITIGMLRWHERHVGAPFGMSEPEREYQNCLSHILRSALAMVEYLAGGNERGIERESAPVRYQNRLARAVMRLAPNLEPDAEIENIEITVRNPDGSTVTYATGDESGYLVETLHGDSECVTAVYDETGNPVMPESEES